MTEMWLFVLAALGLLFLGVFLSVQAFDWYLKDAIRTGTLHHRGVWYRIQRKSDQGRRNK